MLEAPMRRFPLRLKIAAFAAGLILLATVLVALFTVILPWRAKLKAQERLASQLVKTALPLGIDLRADGAYFDPARVHALVANSSRVQGVEIVYALIWDDKGNLDSAASSVNTKLLQKASEPLAQLYLRDPARALQILAIGHRQSGIRRLPIKLAAEGGGHSIIGRLDLGLSTMAIDSELRRSLIRDAFVLVGTLFFAVLSALSIARRIAQPLTDLSAAMGRVREGDFEITAAPSTRTNDEIGDLARSFDEMAQGLKERERLRGTLGRYVSGDVAERILSEDDDLSLRGEVARVDGDRRRGEPGPAARVAGARGRGAGVAAGLREGGHGSGGLPAGSGEAEGQVQAGPPLGDPAGQGGRDGGRVRRAAAALLIAALVACDDDKAVPDELTIVVQADRREVEQQEKALREREDSLAKDKAQLDQRIADLAKGLKAAADAEQRRRLEEELRQSQVLEGQLGVRVSALQAQKIEVEAKKRSVDADLQRAAQAALDVRAAAVAAREAKMAEREAQLAGHERDLAQRAKDVALREKAVAAFERQGPPPEYRDRKQVPKAPLVEEKHKKLLADLDARGILISDLPPEDQPLNAEIFAARRQRDFARAMDLLNDLTKAMAKLRVDQRFVEAKISRLQGARGTAKLSDTQRGEI